MQIIHLEISRKNIKSRKIIKHVYSSDIYNYSEKPTALHCIRLPDSSRSNKYVNQVYGSWRLEAIEVRVADTFVWKIISDFFKMQIEIVTQ